MCRNAVLILVFMISCKSNKKLIPLNIVKAGSIFTRIKLLIILDARHGAIDPKAVNDYCIYMKKYNKKNCRCCIRNYRYK